MATGAIVLPAGSAGAGAALHVTHWLPATAPKAVVLLAHGYAEHAGRYAHVAKRLTDAGYAVYAVDHWGHGRSDGTPGFVPRFSAFTDGMAELLTLVEVNHGDTPRLLLGHSMGGLIATLFLIGHQQAFVAAALSGPAIVPGAPPSRFTVWISRFLSRFFPRLGVLSLDANGVSRDPAVVAAYLADPLVYTGKIGARLGKEFMDAMAAAQAGAPKIRLPILLQHGEADSLASAEGSQYLFDHVSSADKTLKIYPGLFHEIYNEPERDAVLDDLIGWFDAHVAEG
ncbi:alpha/beta hydrolase [Sphingopyxis macrogoltabida]|uniref:Monoacylglycerol lipase n=1 Tax=Sphingopyxis macrogoltabida TaxID=33050 RepID=A0AAC8YXG3_SPHMC|nr:alpha/beta hydrolase [Sphingopyxis macrogoltabida]ALJ11740.1 acylglycerol lipase [Sphingopyxis macrogoltabida]AMU87927.1 lipase [Sphingopyxis macrogoltabida]